MQRTFVFPVILFLMISLANTISKAHSLETTTTTFPTAMLTPNAPGHVKIRRIPKPKLFRSNPHKLITILINPDSDTYIDDDGIIIGRRRNVRVVDEKEEELSDYVKIRLMLARMKAMKAYSMASLSK